MSYNLTAQFKPAKLKFMSVANITFCNDIYLTFVEHIKLFSSLHPNYHLSFEENQRKSSEGFY